MKLTHPADALKGILASVRPLPVTRLPFDQAVGYCLARDVRADRDQPPTDRSAVDGYALQADSLADPPRTLRLIGESAAGSPCARRVTPETCVRVLTGAVVPSGADAVIMVEQTRERSGQVLCRQAVPRGANIRRRGEEARKGDVVLPAAALLGGAQVGLCAAVGKAMVAVRARPRVAVLSTGRELRSAGQGVRPYQIRDANGPALCAALKLSGVPSDFRGVVGDDRRSLQRAIRSALDHHDVLLLSGGVSVGRYDLVPDAIRSLRGRIRLHGVAMKPGKPFLHATLGRKHVFGLPGNPVSVLAGLHQFVLPALRRLAGMDPAWCRPTVPVTLAAAATAKGPRVEYRLARLTVAEKPWRARILASAGSADLAAANLADGMVELDPRNKRQTGSGRAPFIPWRPIW